MKKYKLTFIIFMIILFFLITEINAFPVQQIDKQQDIQYLSNNTLKKIYDDVTWMKYYGKLFGSEQGKSVAQTDDGGYIFLSSGIGLVKVDSYGNVEWEKPWGGLNVITTMDGGYMIMGGGYSDIWLLKLDSFGDEEWVYYYGGDDHEVLNYYYSDGAIQQTTEGGFIFTCSTRSYVPNDVEISAWLVKTDMNGMEEWNTTFSLDDSTWGYSVQQTTDGGFILGGYSAPNNFYNGFLIKTDPYGNEEWTRTYNDSGKGYFVCQTSDGGYILAGESGDTFVIKTDSQGQEEWKIFLPREIGSLVFSIDYTSDNGLILACNTGYRPGSLGLCLVKIDENGNIEWSKTFTENESAGYCVRETNDGGFILIGYKYQLDISIYLFCDTWLIKTDSMGNAEKIDSSYPIINMI